jgi:hypothetical protein
VIRPDATVAASREEKVIGRGHGGGLEMTRQTILIAIAVVGLIAPAAAQSIKGSGSDDCGEWLQYRQSVATQPRTARISSPVAH